MKYLILLVSIFITTTFDAQELSIKDSIDLYNGKSITVDSIPISLDTPNYERALELSRRIQYKMGEFRAIMLLGDRSLDNGDTDFAVKYYQQAYSIADNLDDPGLVLPILNGMGIAQMNLQNYNKAINYFLQVKDLCIQENNKLGLGHTYTNLAGALLSMEKGDSAMVYMKQALEVFEAESFPKGEQYVLNNMGVYYNQSKQPEKALQYFERILQMEIIDSDPQLKGTTYTNMAKAFGALGNHRKAEELLFKSLDIHKKNNFRNKEFIVYASLAHVYKLKGDFKKAFEYQEKHYLLRDSVVGAENQEKIAALELQYEYILKDKELVENREQLLILEREQRNSRIRNGIIFLSLLSLLTVVFFILYRLRKKRKQLLQENQQIKSDFQKSKEKSVNLEEQLETKTKDLTDFALDMNRRNEIANQILVGLTRLEKNYQNKPSKEIKTLKSLLSLQNQINEDNAVFQENIDKVNYSFFNALKNSYPSLSKNELHLFGLLRLNLSTKDIASLRNIAPKSIEMSRYRLRKKLKLEKGEDLSEFLMMIESI